jgi:hypothetical protein
MSDSKTPASKTPATHSEPLAPYEIESPEGRMRRAGAERVQEIIGQLPETTHQAPASARQVVNDLQRAGEATADVTARTAEAAVNLTRQAVERNRTIIQEGEQAAAEMGVRAMDAGYGHGRHMLTETAQVSDIYRGGAENAVEQMRGLFACWFTLGRGAREIQQAMLGELNRAVGRSWRKPHDLLHCRSMVEAAELQRDLYLDAMNYVVESSNLLLQMTGRTVQDAMRPLQGRQ